MNETSSFSYPLKLHLSLSPLARYLKIMSKEIKVPQSPLHMLSATKERKIQICEISKQLNRIEYPIK